MKRGQGGQPRIREDLYRRNRGGTGFCLRQNLFLGGCSSLIRVEKASGGG